MLCVILLPTAFICICFNLYKANNPRLRYKDTIKRNLKKRDIDTNSWKSLALQRDV